MNPITLLLILWYTIFPVPLYGQNTLGHSVAHRCCLCDRECEEHLMSRVLELEMNDMVKLRLGWAKVCKGMCCYCPSKERVEVGGVPLMSGKWKSEPPGSSLSLSSVRTSRSRWLSRELRSQGAQQLLCFTHKHTPRRNTINLPLSGWENQGLHLHLIEQHRPQEIITPMLISLLYKQDIVDFNSEVNRSTVSLTGLLTKLRTVYRF